MDPCDNQRQEEYRKHLRMNRVLNLLMRHSNLLHNLISLLVIVSFGNLLVVNNQHRCHNEQYAKEDTDEKEPAIQADKLTSGIHFRFYRPFISVANIIL